MSTKKKVSEWRRPCYIERMRFIFFLLLIFVVSCAEQPKEDVQPPLVLRAASFSELPGWGGDDLAKAVPAWRLSCARILKRPADAVFGPIEQAGTYGNWQSVCRDFLTLQDQSQLKAFFEQRFNVYQVLAGEEPEGLFTGYYEASLRGSLSRQGPYRYPLHARPDDLVMVDLGEFREELKGQRIAGRVMGGNLKPYESRAEIVAGRWPHNDKVLVWVDDAVDAFFVQIQGSGVVELAAGGVMRIGYAGQNGHPYYAIGRELIARGHLAKEDVSMQAIREWLAANPDEADEIMNTNKSYVFFQQSDKPGAIGGEGVVLTAGRSLAVDRSELPYGLPLWVDIEAPAPDAQPLRRLMIAQDTGGAIRGPVRGDVFWGFGERAEALAGPMKAKGRYWALLPK